MFKEKIKSMLNLYLKMLENTDFEEIKDFELDSNKINNYNYSKKFEDPKINPDLKNETKIPFEE